VRGRRRSVENYIKDRIDELYHLGGRVRRVHTDFVEDEEALFNAEITFGDLDVGTLWIFEHVSIVEGVAQPAKYGYQCLYEEAFLFRYDFDPIQHPEMPYHKHLPPGDRRIGADEVTFHDVMEELCGR
jgi:hypothetical protein